MLERGIFAIIRLNNLDIGLSLAAALAERGVRGIEFTLTSCQSLSLIGQAQAGVEGRAAAGMGTVTDPASAREAKH